MMKEPEIKVIQLQAMEQQDYFVVEARKKQERMLRHGHSLQFS